MTLIISYLNLITKGRKKNENIFKPVRLSSQMMDVFKTTAKYQEPNKVRAMLATYKKNLQVCINMKQAYVL